MEQMGGVAVQCFVFCDTLTAHGTLPATTTDVPPGTALTRTGSRVQSPGVFIC